MRAVTGKLLTYAVGREMEYFDAPAIRGIVRAAAADNYRWSATILAIVKSTPFQMRRVAVMMVTTEGDLAADRAARPRHHRRPAAARRHGAGPDGAAEDAGRAGAPPGRRLSPERRDLRELAPQGHRPRLHAVAHPRAARAIPEAAGRRDGSVEPPGRSAGRRRRRPLARLGVVSHRRARQEVGQRRRQRHVDGPDCRQGLRTRDAAVVAAVDRGRQQPGRGVRRRLQLRLQQHAVVADPDAAADGGKQPARRLRAPVRRE